MNNPLRQYFRRPALFISLPSKGKYYPEGAIEMPESGEFPVYPMTAIDEITAKTPDALFNGSAVADIIKSCVPAIKDPWAIPATDLDAILIGIRAASNGNELDIESECPSCSEVSKYGVNLVGLLNDIKGDSYTETLKLGELTIHFMPLNYRGINQGNLAQFELQREIAQLETITDDAERTKKSNETMKKLTEMNISFMAKTIASIDLPNETVTDSEFIAEYLHSCDRASHEIIRKQIVKMREAVNVKPLKIKCVSCSNEYNQPLALNVTDFFE